MSIDIEIPRYTIIRQLGAGGMAVVYLATQQGLDRKVAVKVLRDTLTSGGEEFKRRFEHEGRMLAQLEHQNIVKIYDIGSTDRAVYMVMEYLRGGTLTQKMQSGDLQLRDAIKVCAQIGLALHVAHRKSIIHRDLKPSNIMFRDPETPVLTDFGIARKIDMDLTLTETGMMIGTPQYMSPEQIKGRPVDARSDIYSLGLMFYRLLTGQMPFGATDPIALAMQQIQEPPPPLPAELSELQPVLDLMLAKEPQDRYQSTLDFCNHLRTISLTGEEYSTQISNATRVFSSSSLGDPGSLPSLSGKRVQEGQPSAVSRSMSSISTAISSIIGRKKPRYVALSIVLAVVLGAFVTSRLMSPGLTDAEIKRVNLEMREFNAQLSRMDIFSPEGANATETLLAMQQVAPDYDDVRDAAAELAAIYEGYAYKHLSEGELDRANELIQRARDFAPDHEGLGEIGESVAQQVAERDRLIRVDQLLQQGSQALASGNLLPPDSGNALQAFLEVRDLDVQNQAAEAGLSEIQRRLAASIREIWQDGQRDEARARTLEGLGYFAESTLLLDLKADIEREEQLEREQREIERLLALAEEQYASGNLVEPPGYNALESFQQVRALRPNEPGAEDGLRRIADHFLEIARADFESGAFQDSLTAAAEGLKAVPDHPSLLLAQDNATARLDARNREIQTRLQQAQRLLAAGQLIPGQPGMGQGAENALEAFNRVLEVDPGNARVMGALADLPRRVEEAAAALERDGDLQAALGMLQAAQQAWPEQASSYAGPIATVEQRIAQRAADRAFQEQLAEADALIEQRPLTTERISEIANALLQLGGEDRYQLEVSERLGRFIAAISEQADAVSLAGDDTQALQLLERGLILYPGNPALQSARTTVERRKIDRAEQERQRIAAMSGVLAVDATPWARVVEIRNSQQEPQRLPEATETPISFRLVEGDYTIVLAAADGQRTFELQASVERQQVNTVRPPVGLIDAEDYFERSGW